MIERDEIAEAIARTLWLCAYSDAVDSGTVTGPDARGGMDWDDVTPDGFPPEALKVAERIIHRVELATREGITVTAEAWHRNTYAGVDIDRFGHCLALQAVGHGVGLEDDIPGKPPKWVDCIPSSFTDFGIWDVAALPEGIEWAEGGDDD